MILRRKNITQKQWWWLMIIFTNDCGNIIFEINLILNNFSTTIVQKHLSLYGIKINRKRDY